MEPWLYFLGIAFIAFLFEAAPSVAVGLLIVGGLVAIGRFAHWTNTNEEYQQTKRRQAEQALASNPPWSQVRQIAFEVLGRSCASCGAGYDLQVHHVRPVSQGGTNSLENLQVLCRSCHNKIHGQSSGSGEAYGFEQDFVDMDDADESEKYDQHGRFPGRRTQKAIRIMEAIDAGQNIRFDYKKWEATEQESRRVIPIRIYVRDQRQYLVAYCLDRRAERNFRLARMKNIEPM